MDAPTRWVLLAYRLPREPSTPRSALWRKLRRLGAVQVLDGLVGLPLDARTREQFEWLAEMVVEANGEASLWIGAPVGAAQSRQLAGRMAAAVAEDYRALAAQARAARPEVEPARWRTLRRLRRELRRVAERDYFPTPEREEARAAVEELVARTEVPT